MYPWFVTVTTGRKMIRYISYFLIKYLLLFQGPVFSLKVTLKATNLSFQSFSQEALKEIFIDLRKSENYDSIAEILQMKSVDVVDAYTSSCFSMSAKDYKGLVEHFYHKDKIVLGMVLSSECIMSMDKNNFLDPNIYISISEMPISLLAVEKKSFDFRSERFCRQFCRIVSQAQGLLTIDTNWDNLVVIPQFQTNLPISLKQALSSCTLNQIDLLNLFYYLNPSMIAKSQYYDDILWLIELALPRINSSNSLIEIIKTSKYIDGQILSFFTLQLFKTVTTLSFFFEIHASLSKKSNATFLKGKKMILRSFVELHEFTSHFLSLNPPCPPLKHLLYLMDTLISVFVLELNTIGRGEINFIFKSIFRSFSNYVPECIQGDWLYNIFYIFFRNKSSKLCKFLSEESVMEGLEVFFSRRPTNSTIKKIQDLLNRITTTSFPLNWTFEKSIPEDRLKSLCLDKIVSFDLITNRFQEISFEDRFAHLLRESRKRLSVIDYSYAESAVSYQSLNTRKSGYSRKHFLIETFQSTVLALYRKDSKYGPMRSYGQFKFIENNFMRSVDIRDCLDHFFKLILLIPEFRIIKGTTKQHNKPIIFITPLISRIVSNILGQSLAISIILNIPIPFLIHPSQLEMIFSNETGWEEYKAETKAACLKSPSALNLLEKDRNFPSNSHFPQTLKSYFNSFYRWNSLFFRSEESVSIDNLVENAITECNFQLFSGFEYHFKVSKFTFEEISRIINRNL